jgi:branched-chain amino acid transport system ATP-binding protein
MANKRQKPILLEVNKLRKHYGEVKATHDVSLKVSQGEVLMLVGANGAGKTTFLDLLTGLLRPDQGEIKLAGEKITGLPPNKRTKKGIVKTFQLEHVFADMTVFDHIRTACFSAAGKHYSFFKNVNGEKEVNNRTEEITELFNLTEVKDTLVKNLGHGYRKVIDIATSFAINPKILLVDEPTSGVGEEEKYQIMELLMEQIDAHNLSAMIVEHDLELVKNLGKETIVMHEGEFISRGDPESVFSQEKVVEVLVGRGF